MEWDDTDSRRSVFECVLIDDCVCELNNNNKATADGFSNSNTFKQKRRRARERERKKESHCNGRVCARTSESACDAFDIQTDTTSRTQREACEDVMTTETRRKGICDVTCSIRASCMLPVACVRWFRWNSFDVCVTRFGFAKKCDFYFDFHYFPLQKTYINSD